MSDLSDIFNKAVKTVDEFLKIPVKKSDVPVSVWLPSTDLRLLAPELKGRKFKIKREYTLGFQKPFTNVIVTSCPSCVIQGRKFKEWMLLP